MFGGCHEAAAHERRTWNMLMPRYSHMSRTASGTTGAGAAPPPRRPSAPRAAPGGGAAPALGGRCRARRRCIRVRRSASLLASSARRRSLCRASRNFFLRRSCSSEAGTPTAAVALLRSAADISSMASRTASNCFRSSSISVSVSAISA